MVAQLGNDLAVKQQQLSLAQQHTQQQSAAGHPTSLADQQQLAAMQLDIQKSSEELVLARQQQLAAAVQHDVSAHD